MRADEEKDVGWRGRPSFNRNTNETAIHAIQGDLGTH